MSTAREPFRLGLVGAGRMGRTHLAALGGSRLVAVAGIADPSQAALDAVLAEGTEAACYLDLDELFDKGELDGVLVAAPSALHLEIVRRAVGRGIAVLCEKPCGLTVEETEECLRLAAEAGVVLRVAYWRRFVAELAALRSRVLSGELGQILAVNCYQWDGAPPPPAFRLHSGGILVDMGVHELDQLRWLTGQEVEVLDAAASGLGEGPADPDCAQLVARLSGGATALVSLGRWYPSGDACWVEIFGTTGTERCMFLRPDDGAEALALALRAQAEGFADAVRRAGSAGSPEPAAAGGGNDQPGAVGGGNDQPPAAGGGNDQPPAGQPPAGEGATGADAVAALRLARIGTERLLSR